MDDLISRQAAIDALCEAGLINYQATGDGNGMIHAVNVVKGLPSAQERKTGKWIDNSDGVEGAWNYCSVCGERAIDLYDFCPNCGADMRGEEHETN